MFEIEFDGVFDKLLAGLTGNTFDMTAVYEVGTRDEAARKVELAKREQNAKEIGR